jgi:phage terminase small subunit
MKKSTHNGQVAPAGLGAESRKLWDQTVEEYGITDAASLALLQNACRSLDRLRQAERTVAKDGATYRDRWGQPRPHPAALQIRDENLTFQRCLKGLALDLEPLHDGVGRPPAGV